MKKIMTSFLTTIVLIYAAIAVYLYVAQRGMIYFPQAAARNIAETTYSLSNAGVTLKGWVVNAGKPMAIIYFGGNAESVEANIPDFKRLFKNYTVYLVAYRGYGASEGSPSESGLLSDAEAIYDDIKPRHQTISVIGRSLGTGVATHLSAKRAVEKLVLITPFDSLESVAQAAYPIFPIGVLMKDKYRSVDKVAAIASQSLMLIAEHDGIIPRESSDKLAKEFKPGMLQVNIISGTTHNSISLSSDYERVLREFFQ